MATAYSVGTTFIQVLPSFDNFHKRAAREMRKIGDLKVDVEPKLRESGIQRELDRISRDRQVNLKANLQDEELKAKLRAMEARRSEINIKVDADIAKAEARIRELEGKRGEAKIDVDAEIAKAKAKIESLSARREHINIKTDADIAEAMAKMGTVEAAANRLDGRRVQIHLDADGGTRIIGWTGLILSGLGAIGHAAPAAAAALAAIPNAVSLAGQSIGALVAGFWGIGDAVKALGEREEKAAQRAVTLGNQRAAAQAQIANAVASLERAQIQADRTAITGAQQVADARRAVSDAMEQAARRVEAAEISLSNAQRQAQYAQEQLNRAREEAKERIEDLRLSLRAAALDEEAASLALLKAQQRLASMKAGPNDLEARKLALDLAEAEDRLQEVKRKRSAAVLEMQQAELKVQQAKAALEKAAGSGVSGASLEQLKLNLAKAQQQVDDVRAKRAKELLEVQKAELAVQEAQQRIAKTSASSIEYKEAELAVRQARQNLAEIRERLGDLRKESAHAAQVGVAGDDQVVTARRRVQEATRSVREAETNLQRARSDGARDVRRAQEQLARAQQQAAWAQEDAARSIADAQRSLQEAYRQSGQVGASEAAKVKDAMDNLSPAGKKFATFLDEELKPAFKGVSFAVQEAMLPKLEQSWRQMLKLTPILKDSLVDMGNAIGDLAIKGAEMMTSGPWRKDLRTISDNNVKAFEIFGQAGLNLADALRHIMVVAGPLVVKLGQFTERITDAFRNWAAQKRSSGEMERWFEQMGDRLIELITIIARFAKAVWDITQVLAPVGREILKLVLAVAELVANFAQAHPTLFRIIAVAGILGSAFVALGTGIGRVSGAIRAAIDGFRLIGARISEAAQSTVGFAQRIVGAGTAATTAGAQMSAAGQRMGILRTGFQQGSVAAQQFLTRMQTTPGVMARVATSFSPVVRAVGGATGALGSLGTAMGNVARTAGSRLRTAFSGLLGVLGGPWGLAITAGIGLLGLFAARSAESAQRHAEIKQSAQEVAEALRQENYQLNQNVYAAVAKQAADQGLLQKAKELGIDTGLLIRALAGEEDAQRELAAQISQTIAAHEDQIGKLRGTSVEGDKAAQVHIKQAQKASELKSEVIELSGANQQATQTERAKAEAVDRATGAYNAHKFEIYQVIDAIRAKIDADRAEKNAALQTEGALLNLEEAERRLKDLRAQGKQGTLEYRQAELQLKQAKQGLSDAIKREVDQARESAEQKAKAKGLSNSHTVALKAEAKKLVELANKYGDKLPADMQRYLRKLGAVRDQTGKWKIDLDSLPDMVEVRLKLTEDPGSRATRKRYEGWARQQQGWGGKAPKLRKADGGIVKPMAAGGMLGRPMSSRIAEIVPPNTWRIIGDRMRGDEAFIPINTDPRSIKILEETARRMGFALAPLAKGGLLGMASGGVNKSGGATGGKKAGGSGEGGLDPSTLAELAGNAEVVSDAFEQWQASSQNLTRQGLTPLQQTLDTKTMSSLRNLQQQAGVNSVNAVNKLAGRMPPLRSQLHDTGDSAVYNWRRSQDTVRSSVENQRGAMNRLDAGMEATRRAMNMTGDSANFNWRRTQEVVNSSVSHQRTAFDRLESGLKGARSAMSNTAEWAKTQFARIRKAAADPVRWTIKNPFNEGLIRAWNKLNKEFSVGRKIEPIALKFNRGGRVPGGAGNTDTVPAMLTPGEIVIRKEVAQAHKNFLLALNQGEPEAVQAAGGRWAKGPNKYRKGGIVADTGSAYNAAILRAVKVAKRMDGKPYIYGGASFRGADCSGFMSMLHNAIMNRPVARRAFTTASFRDGRAFGYKPGLKSAFAIGNNPGVHMAGTLAGTNVEAGGSHGRVAYGGPAVGADHKQFKLRVHLPVAGGKFVPGGKGGGGISFADIVADAFKGAQRLSGQITRRFPGNNMAVTSRGFMDKSLAAAEDYANKKLDDLGDLSGPTGGSPAVKRIVRAIAAQYGWGSGREWQALDQLIQRESGWDPTIKNPNSSAAGLFQKMTSIHGPLEPTIAGQARWGLNYIKNRYGSPSAALRAWMSRSPHWYDTGGILPPGLTSVYNGTGQHEFVLNQSQAQNVVDRLNSQEGGPRIAITYNVHAAPNIPSEHQLMELQDRAMVMYGMR